MIALLWQTIAKHHMEANTKETITDEEWELFLGYFQDAFADEVSRLATAYWRDRHIYGMEEEE